HDLAIRARQTFVVGADHVATFLGRDVADEGFPPFRELSAGAEWVLVKPFHFPASQQEDAAQDELRDGCGMSLGVGQSQRRAPWSSENQPAIDSQMLTQALDVCHEVPGGVVDQARVGSALATATLIKQDDSVAARVEEAAHPGFSAATR